MCRINDRNRWLHSMLQLVEFRRCNDDPMTDVGKLTHQQLTIPSAWKLQSYFLARVLNSRPPSLYKHVTFSVFRPFGLSVMTHPPICHPKSPKLLIPKWQPF